MSDPSGVVSFDSRSEISSHLILGLSDVHSGTFLLVSDSVGLRSHELSNSTLRTSGGLDDSFGHRHHSDLNDSNLRLHLLHHS